MKATVRRTGILMAIGVAALVVAAIGYTIGASQAPMYPSVSSPQEFGGSSPESDGAAKDAYGVITEESAEQRGYAASDEEAAGAGIDRMVIRTSNMELRVTDVDKAVEGVRTAARRFSADISDLSMVTGDTRVLAAQTGAQDIESRGPATAYITLRVPAEKLDALELDIAALGAVLTRSSNANDVTEQAVDLDARLKNLRAEEARLRDFLERTNKVSELLQVERELSRVRGEIESMDAQLTYLKRQAARSSLTVTLTEPGPVVQPVGATWGLREAITRGIQAAASLVTTLVTLAIPLAVLTVLVLLIALPLRLIVRRRNAMKSLARESDTDSEPKS